MVTKRHNLNIVVNGEDLEFESQDKINLRINNTLYNPEKVSVTQSEYSFSFSVPTTPKNNKIFGLANIPSVKGKFVRQFKAYVYVDNMEIFNGLLRISSIEDNTYKCNLISVKNSSIEDIFGDSTMNQIRWEIPYLGGATINATNFEKDAEVFYPLVCYGAFQKDPYLKLSSDSTELNYYTGTNLLDKWTKFYGETFIPSPKLIEVIKKMIEQKGYTYSGDVFNDDLINKLYLSSYIDSEQDPAYNYGGNRGKITVDFKYNINHYNNWGSSTNGRRTSSWWSSSSGTRNERSLRFPEDWHYLNYDKKNDNMGDDVAAMYDLWNETDAEVLKNNNRELWEGGFIVIPHDGYYKVKVYTDIKLTDTETKVGDSYPYLQRNVSSDLSTRTSTLKHKAFDRPMTLDSLPYDVQLVKNDSIELEFIADNKIKAFNHPVPPADTAKDFYSGYPHEASYVQSSTGYPNRSSRQSVALSEYYFQKKGKTRGYDRYVNGDFVMGMSTATNSWSVAKRGRSWNKEYSEDGKNNYKCEGYSRFVEEAKTYSGGTRAGTDDTTTSTTDNTDYQNWQDTDVPNCTYTKLSTKQHQGEGEAIMWFNKNDLLSLKLLTKQYSYYENEADDGKRYYTIPSATIAGYVTIEAFSPNKADLKKSYYSQSSFDKNLNIGNFLSKSETQKDFFNNFLTTFNLSCNVENGNININKNVGMSKSRECIDVDDRITVSDVETEVIDFPTSIEVKWTVDTDESGFYHSVGDDHINDDDWKDWGDYGYKKINLIPNDFAQNDISKTSKFSHNWWMDFQLTDYYRGFGGMVHETFPQTLTLPIIAKDENFIDGADYDDMMKVDGRGLKQRLWFKSDPTDMYVPNRNYTTYDSKGNVTNVREYINICLPTRFYNGQDVLKYTDEDGTLLTRYFNVNENVDSNYATIEVYLTPWEYLMIKNGAMVRFDNDRYVVCSITGYDPTGGNKTKIKMMKQ